MGRTLTERREFNLPRKSGPDSFQLPLTIKYAPIVTRFLSRYSVDVGDRIRPPPTTPRCSRAPSIQLLSAAVKWRLVIDLSFVGKHLGCGTEQVHLRVIILVERTTAKSSH